MRSVIWVEIFMSPGVTNTDGNYDREEMV